MSILLNTFSCSALLTLHCIPIVSIIKKPSHQLPYAILMPEAHLSNFPQPTQLRSVKTRSTALQLQDHTEACSRLTSGQGASLPGRKLIVGLNIWPVQATQGWYLPCSGNTWKTEVLKALQQLPLNLT